MGRPIARESEARKFVRLRSRLLLSAFGRKIADGKGPRIGRAGARNDGGSGDVLGGDCRVVPSGTSSVASGVRIGAR